MKPLPKFLKKLITVIFILLILGALVYDVYRLNQNRVLRKKEETSTAVESVFKNDLQPIFEKPQRIIIDSVGIDVAVEEVGVDKDGAMEVPSSWQGAGWYRKSAMPGENGNILIDAHYDDNFGRPAAFFQLKNVKVDDTVTVVDEYGRRYSYRVVSYDLVGIYDPNRSDVFKNDGSAKITLITCGGVWIPGKATYDKRLVIKGELIQ